MEQLKKYIRSVPDFPKPGINFYDVTTLFQNPVGFNLALDGMEEYVRSRKADKIVAIEARGFILGAALADRLNIGLVPARKPGKLPWRTITEEYSLEYGTDRLQMHADAVQPGERVVIVDDLIATGGTLGAACKLVEQLGGKVVGISSVIGLNFLPYRQRLAGYDLHHLIAYDSE
ncbi:adenine phosphoribosyltransferase [candidate division GN15 bacterium]|uniref:Adenine phosphoribosyltransferase n=1 Tax=candidate division GN15 bacterium TaxID=2072418 RepID=A0A855X2T7_9BACT|nr:MAG: adenine phosphoribosyltransferase [candidate division GN15 bacterium]